MKTRKLTRWKGESIKAWNLRKARHRKAELEVNKTIRERAWQESHPSDTPMEKFKRVWENHYGTDDKEGSASKPEAPQETRQEREKKSESGGDEAGVQPPQEGEAAE